MISLLFCLLLSLLSTSSAPSENELGHVRVLTPSVRQYEKNVYGLAVAERALIWIHDPMAFQIVEDKPVKGPAQRSASCNILGLGDGRYTIEWFDTSTGQVVRRDSAEVNHLTHFGYGIDLKPPQFWGDIAARIIREGLQW